MNGSNYKNKTSKRVHFNTKVLTADHETFSFKLVVENIKMFLTIQIELFVVRVVKNKLTAVLQTLQ